MARDDLRWGQSNYWKRRQSRRTFLGGAAVAGIGTAALMAGCGDDSSGGSTPGAGATSPGGTATSAATSQAGAPQPGGELSLALTLAPSTLDPHLGNSGGDDVYWRAICDTLVGVDQEYKPQQALSLHPPGWMGSAALAGVAWRQPLAKRITETSKPRPRGQRIEALARFRGRRSGFFGRRGQRPSQGVPQSAKGTSPLQGVQQRAHAVPQPQVLSSHDAWRHAEL